jgi:hypothetical protein
MKRNKLCIPFRKKFGIGENDCVQAGILIPYFESGGGFTVQE